VSYRVEPRTTVTGAAEYSTTNSPVELNADTGLIFSRAKAERLVAHGAVTRRLTPTTASTADYVFTEYSVAGALSILTHAATLGVNRRVSLRDTVTADYQLHQYVFGSFAQTSHGLRIGWSRTVTESSTFEIAGGPRLTGGAASPELSASMHRRFESGDLSLAYARTQTTSIGLARTVETQRVSATGSWKPRPTLRTEVSGAFYRSTEGALLADVQRLSLAVTRRMTRTAALEAMASVYVQRNTLGALRDGMIAPVFATGTIPQQVVMIRCVVDRTRAW